MSELDEAWEMALDEAHRQAQDAGRADIAAYLRLRASNDFSRKAGIEWLLSTFEKLAGDANRGGASLQISKEDLHRFSVDHATMVGPRLTLSFGVRSISIEAGWPRVPSDSFLRGGGLARGRINHFGKQSLNEDLLLSRSGQAPPSWLVIGKSGKQEAFHEMSARSHISKLLSSDYR